MPVVSVTRLHLRSVRFLPAFFWYSKKSARQAKKTPGNLGAKLRKTHGLAFWTLTMWQNRGALRTFVSASPHKEAMQRLPYWCDEGAFADWEEDSTQWPHWEEAAQRLSANGRLAQVLYPSAQQQQGKVVTS
jgi:uncharacterized protein DUF3291